MRMVAVDAGAPRREVFDAIDALARAGGAGVAGRQSSGAGSRSRLAAPHLPRPGTAAPNRAPTSPTPCEARPSSRDDDRLSDSVVRRRRARASARRSCWRPTGAISSTIPGPITRFPSGFSTSLRPLAAAIAAVRGAASGCGARRRRPADGSGGTHQHCPWLAGNPPAAAARSRNKLQAREAFQPAPVCRRLTFRPCRCTTIPTRSLRRLTYPAVLKPLALSGSRGVMRVNDRQRVRRGVRAAARR